MYIWVRKKKDFEREGGRERKSVCVQKRWVEWLRISGSECKWVPPSHPLPPPPKKKVKNHSISEITHFLFIFYVHQTIAPKSASSLSRCTTQQNPYKLSLWENNNLHQQKWSKQKGNVHWCITILGFKVMVRWSISKKVVNVCGLLYYQNSCETQEVKSIYNI